MVWEKFKIDRLIVCNKKIIWSFIALLLFAALGFIVFRVRSAWQKFIVEDQIHGVFYPVVNALYDFKKDNGLAPENLAQLVPKYITEIPVSSLVSSVNYRTKNNRSDWDLSLYSTVLDPPRYYNCRSNGEYTEAEKRRIITFYHGTWTVLSEPK
jgi:hypothetical protein